MEKKLNMTNVVPVYPGHSDFTISEIRRQYREARIDRVALCLSFHPQCTPARDLIPILCGLLRDVKNGVKDLPVEIGVLIQSTEGHGWNGKVPLTQEPWQQIINLDMTKSPRMCPLDPGFRAYVHEAIRKVTEEGVKFLLIDDDFGMRRGECLCPLHLARFNEATGKHYTLEEASKLLSERPWDDPEVMAFSKIRKETALEFARDIRSAINEVDPTVRCGLCTPAAGQGFIEESEMILAGGTEPFIRVNDALYGMQNILNFYYEMMVTHRVRYQAPSVTEFIDEADTFPQNYYSESALGFHAHITNALLNGLYGCKLWTSEFCYPEDTGSQRRYEYYLGHCRDFYETLFRTLDGVQWKGVSGLLFRPAFLMHVIKASGAITEEDWIPGVLGPYAFPLAYSAVDAPLIHALAGNDVKHFSNDELKKLLSGAVLIDSVAAKELTARGLAPLMGVSADDGDDNFHFSKELDEDGVHYLGLMWEGSMARLTPVCDGVRILTQFCKDSARSDEREIVSPGMTFYRNELGGRVIVVGWEPTLPFYKTLRPMRRVWLRRALDLLADGVLEMSVENAEQQILVRHGVLADGRELVSVQSLAIDVLPYADLRLTRDPVEVEELTADGSWKPVSFRRVAPDLVRLDREIPYCSVEIFRFKF